MTEGQILLQTKRRDDLGKEKVSGTGERKPDLLVSRPRHKSVQLTSDPLPGFRIPDVAGTIILAGGSS